MSAMTPYILAIRPKTLFASAGPVILGLGTAWYLQKGLDPLVAVTTLVCALLMQMGTNLVNDYFDHESGVDEQRSHGPVRVTQAGLVSPQKVRNFYRLCFALAFILGISLMFKGGLPIVVIGLSSLLFAYIYTAGPFPLSHHGLGEITAFVFFGPVAVWGTGYLQTGEHSQLLLWAGLLPGIVSALLMAINNLRDRQDDEKIGKTTLAVLMGERRARGLCLLLVIASGLVPSILFFKTGKALLIIAAILPLFFWRAWKRLASDPVGPDFNLSLAATGKYLFFACLLTALALVWNG